MAIDLETEQLISLEEAAQLFPRTRRGKKPSRATVYRWTTVGICGVVLETFRAGGYRATSREAVMRFLSALNPGHKVVIPSRKAAIRAAEAALADL